MEQVDAFEPNDTAMQPAIKPKCDKEFDRRPRGSCVVGLLVLSVAAFAAFSAGCSQPRADEFHEVSLDQIEETGGADLAVSPTGTRSDGDPQTVATDVSDTADAAPQTSDPLPITDATSISPPASANPNAQPTDIPRSADGQASASVRVAEPTKSAASSDVADTDSTGQSQSIEPAAASDELVAKSNKPLASIGDAGGGNISRDRLAKNTKTADDPSKADRKVQILVKEREFKVEGPENALRTTYDDFDLLKVLNMDPVPLDAPKSMPAWLKGLDGKRIRLRGFMYPPIQETGLRGFVLARDNQICCFGRNPKPYDIIEVTMREGVTVGYIQSRPFDVVGRFHISPLELDGRVEMVYQIDDAIVIE